MTNRDIINSQLIKLSNNEMAELLNTWKPSRCGTCNFLDFCMTNNRKDNECVLAIAKFLSTEVST